MKAFLVTLGLIVLINFKMGASEMIITIAKDFYIPLETIDINCTSSVDIESKAIEITVDNNQVVLVYDNSVECLKKIPGDDVTDPGKSCQDECSCSLNGKSILFKYKITSENKSLNFECSSRTLDGKFLSKSKNLKKAMRPTNISVNETEFPVTVKEGEGIEPISCAAICIPDCTYRWTGPGFIGNNSVFWFDKVVRTDGGTYACEAKNILGTSNTTVQILVLYGPNTITLKPSNISYTIEEHMALDTISCRAECYPECTLTWRGPGITPMRNDLYIPSIKRNNTGQFICSANNTAGEHDIAVEVTVQYGPSVVSLNATSPVTVTERDRVGPISCTADCLPDCRYRWIGPYFTGDNSVLQIDNVLSRNSGVYNCTAFNYYKEKSESTEIIVKYGPDMIKLTPLNQTYTIEEELTLGPISCAAQCNPECVLSWIGPGITSTTNDLHIPTINRNNSGQFTCTATNDVGKVNMTVDVIVQYGAEVTVMNISSSNENVTDNTSLYFICEAIGVPKPTSKWFYTDTFGNTVLVSDNNRHMIQSASCLDTGKYTCLAQNEGFPPHNSSQDINVTCVPRLLNNCSSSYERILAVKRNETKTIYACFLSNPPPRTNWTMHDDNTFINIDESKSQLYKNSTLQYTAALDVVLVEQNELNFTVNAENFLGASTTTSFRIRIEDRPFAPKDVRVICEDENVIHWFSNYNGGSEQNFRIRYTENNGTGIQTTDPMHDKGPTIIHNKVLSLKQNTYYSFVVMAINSINSTTSNAVSCTTRSVQNSDPNFAAIGGGLTAGLLLITAIVLVPLYYRRQLHARTTSKEKANTLLKKTKGSQDEDEDAYGLKDNPIYDSQGDKNAEYSGVSKHRHQEYENSADFHQDETSDIYINHLPVSQMSKNTATTTNNTITNKSGLIYADLDLAPCGSKFVIRGMENRSNYAIIDLTKTAEPLPSSDEDVAKDCEK